MIPSVKDLSRDGDLDVDGDLDFIKVVNGLKTYYRFNIQISVPISEIRDAVTLAYEHAAYYPRAYAIEVLKGRGYGS